MVDAAPGRAEPDVTVTAELADLSPKGLVERVTPQTLPDPYDQAFGSDPLEEVEIAIRFGRRPDQEVLLKLIDPSEQSLADPRRVAIAHTLLRRMVKVWGLPEGVSNG